MYRLLKPKTDGHEGQYVILWQEKGWIFYPSGVDNALHQVRNNTFAWDANHPKVIEDWEDTDIVFNSTEELKLYLLLDG